MTMRDLASNISPAASIVAQAVTATLNGAGVDLRGFDAAAVILDLGTFAGTTPTATVKIQESDDNAAFTDVAAGDLIGGGQLATIDTTNDVAVYERGYIGAKRYLRVAVTAIAGTSPSLPMSAMVVRGRPHLAAA